MKEEFKNKLLSKVEYKEEDNHPQWKRKLREYTLLQNRDVSVILDRETLQLKSVYTPLAVIEREPGMIKPEETTIREIESLKKMNIYTRTGTIDFEYHLTNCSVNNPEVWTKIGNPDCGKTFLC